MPSILKQLGILAAITLCIGLVGAPRRAAADAISPDKTEELGRDAYIYAYPIVLQDMTGAQRTFQHHVANVLADRRGL
ncbi:MAG TPA: hypothetical protein VGG44_06745 [Tepidisphaeraceae bacterium]|jgi:hypothetical protein